MIKHEDGYGFQDIVNEKTKIITQILEFLTSGVTSREVPTSKGSSLYRSDTANSNTVNSKFHLIRSLSEDFARFLSFHV